MELKSSTVCVPGHNVRSSSHGALSTSLCGSFPKVYVLRSKALPAVHGQPVPLLLAADKDLELGRVVPWMITAVSGACGLYKAFWW